MQAVIIAGGVIKDYKKMKKYIKNNAIVICADSGYDHAAAMNINPDLVIGDMDSVKRSLKQVKHVKRFPAKKDYTDTELAVLAALKRNCTCLLLLGASGGRVDHTLANIFLLKSIAERQIPVLMASETSEIYSSCSNIKLRRKAKSVISLFALDNNTMISTKGLEYPLENELLIFGSTRGVSNVFSKCDVEIVVHRGCVMAILPA